MLDAIAINYQGVLIVEQSAQYRRIRTNSVTLPALFNDGTGEPLVWQGDGRHVWWWHEHGPYYRPDAIRVVATSFVTIYTVALDDSVPSRWSHSTIHWAGPADFNVDGSVDVFDFLAFQNAFAMGDMAADFDRDGVLGFFDFLAYFNVFAPTQEASP